MNNTTSVARRPTGRPPAGLPTIDRPPTRHAGAIRSALSETSWIHRLAAREAPRRLLWLPVALAGGIGAYFSAPVEPSAEMGAVATVTTVALTLMVRRSPVLMWLALLLVAAALGFAAAQLRTRSLGTVMLDREAWVTVAGRLTAIERRPAGWRLTLVAIAVTQVEPGTPIPTGVRVAVAGRLRDAGMQGLRVGDRIRVRARLQPPSPPVAPGAYDFQRDAYFRGIGAIGFAVGPVVVETRAPAGLADGFRAAVDRVRAAAGRRIRAALPDPAGAVAVAMLIGDRAGIDEPTTDTFRETGLAHLLAISGLHMGLVAGTVYVVLRMALAAWPGVALRRPVKKWAAGVALVAATLYLLLAGAPVPTQRAFLMTGMILGAVMLDREAISLHLVAWAAAAVLLIAPETLTGPSFQLSFAAVTALIAVWEAVTRHRRSRPRGPPGWLRRVVGYFAGVTATSAVASLVTAPVVAHHFQQVPLLGAVANLAAVPLTAFVTMPAGVIALLVMPVGWEAMPLRVMGQGIDATLFAASQAARTPLTAIGVPALGTGPLVLMTIGGLWLALWRSGLRWLGAGAVLTGIVLAAAHPPPDALFAADGSLAAVRIPGTGWALSSDTGNRFVRNAWQRGWGGGPPTGFLSADIARDAEAARTGSANRDGLGCDGLGCVLRIEGRVLAMPSSPEAALEDCTRADLVVTAVRLRRGCGAGGARAIDRSALRRSGALAVWMSARGIRTYSVTEARGRRPWTTLVTP